MMDDLLKGLARECSGKVYLPPHWISVPCGTDGELCRKCRAAVAGAEKGTGNED